MSEKEMKELQRLDNDILSIYSAYTDGENKKEDTSKVEVDPQEKMKNDINTIFSAYNN